MSFLKISAETWGMSNTYTGRAYVSPEGQACPVKIRTSGHGKYSSGDGYITSADYPQGVYLVEVDQDGINITHYPVTGETSPFHDYRLAPEAVIRFAEKFAMVANCYHCKCLDKHLAAASAAAKS